MINAKQQPNFKIYRKHQLQDVELGKYLVDGVIPEGEVGILGGESNIGKTFLALH